MAATTAGLTSTAITSQPWPANWAHSGSPILPAPTTATTPVVPGSPVHGWTRRAVPWAQGATGSSIEPPRREVWRDGRLTIVMPGLPRDPRSPG